MASALMAVPAQAAEVGEDDFRISTMGPDGDEDYDGSRPAVAYNSAANEYLVVWEGDDNGGGLAEGETEIFGQLLSASGAEVGGHGFRISTMGPDGDVTYNAVSPAVTYNSIANEYLVVWHGDDDRGALVEGEHEVFGQRLSASGATIGEEDFRISDMGPASDLDYDAYRPAVVHNSVANEYLVVWEGDDDRGTLVDEEFEVFGQRLSASGGAVGTNDFRVSIMGPAGDPNYDAMRTALAHNPSTGDYLVVWQGDDSRGSLVDNEREVFGQRLDAAGLKIGDRSFRISTMGPDGDAGFAYRAGNPAVTYNSSAQEYLVVWDGSDDRASAPHETEVFGQRLSSAGVEVGDDDFRISTMGPDGDNDYAAYGPDVAYHASADEYLVVWEGDDDRGRLVDDEFEIFGQRLSTSGAGIGRDDFRISRMGPNGDWEYGALEPEVAPAAATGQYLVVWEGGDDRGALLAGEFEIFGQRLSFTEPVGLVDPATGQWHLRNVDGMVTSFYYGNPGDVPVMGDWDCDGIATPGLFRLSDAFAYLKNANTQGIADIRFFFGNPSDVPLAGDWNGDGCDTLSIYRPSEQRFYVVNALGANEGGLGPADYFFDFGNPGDKPVVGDWDGDGVDEVGLHRESSGFFYYRDTLTTGIATAEFFFGDPGDRFVGGDWNATGFDKPAVFRPTGTTFFFRHTLTPGVADSQFVWGDTGWLPVAGAFGL